MKWIPARLSPGIELAKQGHIVHPLDISPALIKRTAENAMNAGVNLEPGVVASATELFVLPGYKGLHFDSILILGPLYHLLDHGGRMSTLNGALSLLKPGGALFASLVTKFAHLRDLASKDPGRFRREEQFYTEYIRTDLCTRSKRSVYHVEPHEIVALFEKVNAETEANLVNMVSCEGFLGYHGASALNNVRQNEFRPWSLRVELTSWDRHITYSQLCKSQVTKKLCEPSTNWDATTSIEIL